MAGRFGMARAGAIIVIAGLAALLAGCDSAQERAQEHFERGQALLAGDAPDDVRAALEFRNALQLDPSNAQSHRALAQIAERGGDLKSAVIHYRAAADLDPKDGESRLRLAQLLLAGSSVENATTYADEALALMPDSADALAAKAAVALRAGNKDEMRDYAKRALAKDPLNSGAGLLMASDEFERGDKDAARARIDALLEKEPDNLSVNLFLLKIISESGDQAAVGRQLDRLVDITHGDTQVLTLRARWASEQGDNAAAEADLRRIADANPGVLERALALARFIGINRGAEAARTELETRADAATDPKLAAKLRLSAIEVDIQTGELERAKTALNAMIDAGGEGAMPARGQLARLLLREGDQPGAMALVEQILATDRENADALALRATVAIDENRTDDAIADLRTARASQPDNPQLMVLEALAYERSGDLSVAADRLAAATRASNNSPDIALRQVAFLRGRGELKAAETVLIETLRKQPADRRVLTALAEVRLQMKDYEGAEQAAAGLRQLGDSNVLADRIDAASLAAQGKTDESTQLLQRSLANEGPDNDVLKTLTRSYLAAGETQKATDLLDRQIAEGGGTMARILRAEIAVRAGDFDMARTLINAAVDAEPDRPAPRMALASLEQLLGDNAAAEAALRSGIEAVAAPQDETLRLKLAGLLETRKDFDGAIAQYRILQDRGTGSLVAANNLVSLIADHRSDDPELMAEAEQIARRLGGYDAPELQDTYGWVLFLRKEIDEALPILQKAAAGLPDNPLVRYHYGRALAAAGKTEEARSELNAALDIDPGFDKAASARETLKQLPEADAKP